ncbi:MAG: hypothetical protein ACJ75J_07420 [Cytophagaceae bacterium]
MNQNLKDHERELIKIVNHFRKRADKLMAEGRLSEEHSKVSEACENLVEKLNLHADGRAEILQQRENLKSIVKDNAACPKCHQSNQLKLVGVHKNEHDWKCNKYKCRKCNIEFVWNRPNNAWDMIPFMEFYIQELHGRMEKELTAPELKAQTEAVLNQMQESLQKLKPVIEASDLSYQEMETRDAEMTKMIKEFKSFLLIEKIKMDAIEDEARNN